MRCYACYGIERFADATLRDDNPAWVKTPGFVSVKSMEWNGISIQYLYTKQWEYEIVPRGKTGVVGVMR